MNPLPSRVGPVVTIVVSALAMVLGPIIGVVVMVGTAVSSVGGTYLQDSQILTNGGQVQISEPGDYAIVVGDSGTDYSSAACTVTDATGADVTTYTVQTIPVFTAESAGSYTISCNTSESSLVVIPSGMIEALAGSAGTLAIPVVIGGVIGLIGLVGLVIGIVWLVKVNGKRKQLAGPGGGYGTPYGAPYNPTGYGQQYQQPYNQQQSGYQGYPQPSTPPDTSTGQADASQPATAPQPDTAPPQYGERIYPPDNSATK